jgi:thioredoxin-related protein
MTMKKIIGLFSVGILLATQGFATEIDGVRPGTWTMDLAAAKAYAAEQKLPILLNFSGSDWCFWCQLMEENIFSQPEWKSYAASNVVMVLIDSPDDERLVPEKYAARNQELKEDYAVEGFPTLIVLDDDGTSLRSFPATSRITSSSGRAKL